MIGKLWNRFTSNKTLLNGTLFSAFSFYNQGLSFLLLILLANYILPADYGQLSLYNTFLMFLGYIIALSSHGYESISFFKKSREGYVSDFSAILFISIFMSLFLSLLVLLLGNFVGEKISLTPLFMEVAIATSFFIFIITMLTDYYRVNENLPKYGALSCGSASINFILSIIMVVTMNMGWEGRVYANLAASGFFAVIATLIVLKNKLITLSFSRDDVKQAACWGIPLIPHLAAIWIKQGGDRYIINSAYSLDEVGLFSFALNLMNIIMIFGVAFNSTNSVSIYKILSNNEPAESKRDTLKVLSRKMVVIYFWGSVAIVLAVCSLVPILLPNYKTAVLYFPILSIAGFFNCIYFVYCNYLFYYGCNKSIMKYTFFTALLHLLLSLICTPISLYMTSVIYIVSQFFVVILVYRKSRSLLKERL